MEEQISLAQAMDALVDLAEEMEAETLRREGPTSDEFWGYQCISTMSRAVDMQYRLVAGLPRNMEFSQEWAVAFLALLSMARMYLEPDQMVAALRGAPGRFRAQPR